jgi:competence protein ComEC
LLAIIMYEPDALLHDVSLHLSFLATAGIVYVSAFIKGIIEKHIRSGSLTELASTTLSAYLATLPYVCYMFGTISPYALIANMIALPFVPLAMFLSFIVVCASYVSNALAMVVGYVDTLLLNLLILIARAVEALPFSYVRLPTSFIGMCLLYGIFGCVLIYMRSRKENETLVTTESGYATGIIKY